MKIIKKFIHKNLKEKIPIKYDIYIWCISKSATGLISVNNCQYFSGGMGNYDANPRMTKPFHFFKHI